MANYNVAYGKRENILPAIQNHIIPPNTIILTDDSEEILFYDDSGTLKTYKERQEFETLELAQEWVDRYGCQGNIISVHEGDKCSAYVVNYDGKLELLGGGTILQGLGDSSVSQDIEGSFPGRFVYEFKESSNHNWRIVDTFDSSTSVDQDTGDLLIHYTHAGSNITIELDLPIDETEGYCVLYVYGEDTNASFNLNINGITSKIMESNSLKDDARGNRPVAGEFILKSGTNTIIINNATGDPADLHLTSLIIRGQQSISSGYGSASFGSYNNVSGSNSMAVNYDNVVEGMRSFAAGASNYIGPDVSAAFIAGWHNLILNHYQTAFGRFNNPDPDAYFMVGNGADNNRRNNAFTVCKDGSIKINEYPLTIDDILTLLSLSNSTGDMMRLTDNINYLKSKMTTPQALYMSPRGNIRTFPLDYTIGEEIHKFYHKSQGGPGDVTADNPINYTEFSGDGDRNWAWLGTTASTSNSAGKFAYFSSARCAVHLATPDEWVAFKVHVSNESLYSVLGTFWHYKALTGVELPLEIYVLPFTEERSIEFNPANTETYGIIESAQNSKYPNQLKRTGAKSFADLTSIKGESPVGTINIAGPDNTVSEEYDIGEIDLFPGEYLLLIRAVKKIGSIIFSEFQFNSIEFPITSLKIGETRVTEDQVKKLLELI